MIRHDEDIDATPGRHGVRLRRLGMAIGLGAILALGLVTVASANPNGGEAVMNTTTSTAAALTVSDTSTAVIEMGAVTLPACPAGQAPLLKIARYPSGKSGGAASPEAAVRAMNPTVGALSAAPWSTASGAPVWFAAGSETFVATVLPDGTWFASPATFVSCKSYDEIYRR